MVGTPYKLCKLKRSIFIEYKIITLGWNTFSDVSITFVKVLYFKIVHNTSSDATAMVKIKLIASKTFRYK